MSLSTQEGPTVAQSDFDTLVHANHWDPFGILGPHEVRVEGRRAQTIRAFLPEAKQAWVVDLVRGEPGEYLPMDRLHPDGFFERVFPDRADRFPYRLAVEDHENHRWQFVDPYQFGPVLTDYDLHLLGEGTH